MAVWPWHWNLRVRIANIMMRLTLAILPPCRYRRELNEALWTLNMNVQAQVAAYRSAVR